MADTILLNDFKRQWSDVRDDVMGAVERVGASGWYILGDSVRAFERAVAESLERRFTIGCASGLDAIEIALRALELPPGAPVLTTPLSAFATTLAILRAGGVPVFVDVDERGNLDLDLAERLLESRKDITYLVPVHLYGNPLDLDRLAALRQRFSLRVVEDCAQSIGARQGGRPAGSVGDLASLSFYPTKNLGALGDGGAVIGDDERLQAVCASLRDYGQSRRYVHDRLGLNSRLDELHAAILDGAFLPRLPRWTRRRQEIAARYLAGLSHPHLVPLGATPGAEPVWHLFATRVPPAARAALQAYLQESGVQSAIHYPSIIPDQTALDGQRFEVAGELPRARALADGELSLPIHPYLTDAEVDRVVEVVNRWRGP